MMVAVQSQLAELRAQQVAQEEAHRQQLAAQQEAHRRQLEAIQEHSVHQLKEFASFLQGLEIPGFRCPPLPPVIFAPPPLLAPPPVPSPLGTPPLSAGSNTTPHSLSTGQVGPGGVPPRPTQEGTSGWASDPPLTQ